MARIMVHMQSFRMRHGGLGGYHIGSTQWLPRMIRTPASSPSSTLGARDGALQHTLGQLASPPGYPRTKYQP